MSNYPHRVARSRAVRVGTPACWGSSWWPGSQPHGSVPSVPLCSPRHRRTKRSSRLPVLWPRCRIAQSFPGRATGKQLPVFSRWRERRRSPTHLSPSGRIFPVFFHRISRLPSASAWRAGVHLCLTRPPTTHSRVRTDVRDENGSSRWMFGYSIERKSDDHCGCRQRHSAGARAVWNGFRPSGAGARGLVRRPARSCSPGASTTARGA
jgi:hypothetical protein